MKKPTARDNKSVGAIVEKKERDETENLVSTRKSKTFLLVEDKVLCAYLYAWYSGNFYLRHTFLIKPSLLAIEKHYRTT